MDFGYVIINGENDYTVNVDLNSFGSGYNVVPKDVDPYNIYEIDDVKAYIEANPDKVFDEHPLLSKHNLTIEKNSLESYLESTDYMVVKCMERGLKMEEEYPTEYTKRQKARDRINEIEALLAEV